MERLELIILEAIATGDDMELAHIADHVGMGHMDRLRGVNSNAIREFFAKLSPDRQLVVLKGLEACEW